MDSSSDISIHDIVILDKGKDFRKNKFLLNLRQKLMGQVVTQRSKCNNLYCEKCENL